jgi:1-acyl-sn-glycerol-3-phosphate acyltransferase
MTSPRVYDDLPSVGLTERVTGLLERLLIDPELRDLLDRYPKTTGSHHYDPWGFHTGAYNVSVALFKRIYDHYFRVEARGLEHIPQEGRLLIIGNHSGQIPFDGGLVGMAMVTNPHAPRAPRAMIERFFPTVPFLGDFLNRVGGVIGDPANCGKMLQRDEAIIVFPEGVRGSGKLFRQRYELQRFGHGFMHLAMEHDAPIVPVGVVGCEETMPSLANLAPLAKLLGLPYLPLTIPFPLPAKVHLRFGAPLRFEGPVHSEAEVAANVARVKAAIQELVRQGLEARQGVFR